MSGVEERIDYLNETKDLIKQAINETGGEISEDMTFRDYPGQIQVIIDETVIPQSDLDNLVDSLFNIQRYSNV